VDDKRKLIKKNSFVNENAFVSTGENRTKTLVRSKIFCFVLVERKTDTFKSALVWPAGPETGKIKIIYND